MQIHKNTSRFNTVFIFLIICLGIFAVRLILIQVFRSSYLNNIAQKQHNFYIALEPKRGTIYDRNMHPLAVNVAVYSLYAKSKAMTERSKEAAVKYLPELLNVSPDVIQEKLSRPKYFVWLARKLPTDIVDKIKALKINGLDFIKESKRYYPNKFLAAHLIGFAGIDNSGLDGLELVFDKYLKGEYGWSQILRDAKQRELLIEKKFVPPRDGFNVVLTIDETIQYIAERALQRGFEKNNSVGASVIVMDPHTGEILAYANRPTYDLSHPAGSLPEQRVNRAIVYTYEPGSVFKIVTASAALEENVAKEDDKFFCENGKYKVGNHILRDHTPHGMLTFKGVFEESSNIGVCKIAQLLGPQKIYEYIKRYRFGIPTGIHMPGEAPGNIKPPSQWSKTSIGAVPMGQEVTVTAMQLIGAMSSIANGGVYMQPFVVKSIRDDQDQVIKDFEPKALSTVIPPDIAKRVTDVLIGVVENGTGKRAKIEGIKVAGKTGTAQKVTNGTYSHNKFVATFYGFAPADDPKLAIIVTYDEPHPDYYGGTVAAPIFQEVMENSLKYFAAK